MSAQDLVSVDPPALNVSVVIVPLLTDDARMALTLVPKGSLSLATGFRSEKAVSISGSGTWRCVRKPVPVLT